VVTLLSWDRDNPKPFAKFNLNGTVYIYMMDDDGILDVALNAGIVKGKGVKKPGAMHAVLKAHDKVTYHRTSDVNKAYQNHIKGHNTTETTMSGAIAGLPKPMLVTRKIRKKKVDSEDLINSVVAGSDPQQVIKEIVAGKE